MADLSILNGLTSPPTSAPSLGTGKGTKGGATGTGQLGKGFSGYLHDSLAYFPQPQTNQASARQLPSGSVQRSAERHRDSERPEKPALLTATRESRLSEKSAKGPSISREDERGDDRQENQEVRNQPERTNSDGDSSQASKSETQPQELETSSPAPDQSEDAEETAQKEDASDAVSPLATPLVAVSFQTSPDVEETAGSAAVAPASAEGEKKSEPLSPVLAGAVPQQPANGDVKADAKGEQTIKVLAGPLPTAMPEQTHQPQEQPATPLLPSTVVTETTSAASETKNAAPLLPVSPSQLTLLAGMRKETVETTAGQSVTATEPLSDGQPALVQRVTEGSGAATPQGSGENATGWMAGGQNPTTFTQATAKGVQAGEESPFRLNEAQGGNSRTTTSAADTVSAATKPALSREASNVMRTEVFRQIVANSELLKKADASELRIQLKPEFLGKVNLNLSVENGIVSVRIAAENPQVRQMIESNLNQLKQSLEEQGLRFDRVEVGVGQQGTDSRHSAGDSQQSSAGRWGSQKSGQSDESASINGSGAVDAVAARSYYREDTTVEFLA
ncbi:hypothetical protein GTO89_10530 [Heliobacterium gestii]|uniref:Flagellar hook-length control protein-like C-terminal domain-containing protein n=1 Tax=Heliomicrobium gestii TaxID=2699 RepID=A0A845LGB3_HELGE|nr:flagellar hook-length control protein FliK [Heliomicrobium gestii]MBM7867111.1 flagellar hook-length control protein FliK [Heliomicrobium gestii]MZP43475.1 hypothetical protein [Heliomicrobium gestii]